MIKPVVQRRVRIAAIEVAGHQRDTQTKYRRSDQARRVSLRTPELPASPPLSNVHAARAGCLVADTHQMAFSGQRPPIVTVGGLCAKRTRTVVDRKRRVNHRRGRALHHAGRAGLAPRGCGRISCIAESSAQSRDAPGQRAELSNGLGI